MATDTAARPAASAYRELAPYYEAYTRHPAYPAWVRRLEGLARAAGLSGWRALDVGCGTGKSTLPLLELGYSVTACEPEPAMLEIAAERTGGRARLVHCGAADLPVLGRFHYVCALNDVVNYIVDREELARALAAMAANLAEGGVLLFDASTPAMYRSLFAETHSREAEGAQFVWTGHAGAGFAEGDCATATLEVAANGRRLVSVHRQRHHPHDVLSGALADAGMRLVSVHGHTDDGVPRQPLDPAVHTKAVYVSVKTS